MEPGHEDREYEFWTALSGQRVGLPQWSPVMKTGNTDPGPEGGLAAGQPQWSPVMKTGNTCGSATPDRSLPRLNGARS